MSAVDTLRSAQVAGVHITVNDGDLILKADIQPPLSILDALKRHKDEIVALVCQENRSLSPDDWKEYFEERAAIREYDGGQSRDEAEMAALEDITDERHQEKTGACGRKGLAMDWISRQKKQLYQ